MAIGKQRAKAAGKIGGAKSRRTTGTFKHSEATKARMSAAQKLRRAKADTPEDFFISDEQINEAQIETFKKQPWYKGWIRSK